MCGIAGFWGPPDPGLLAAMTALIAHRGPDGEGFFAHEAASLGHRRLAIIDPEGGHQPVGTPDGLVQLTYNGEVYNFRELREELEQAGHAFVTALRHRGGAARLPRVGDRLLRPLQRHVGARHARPARRRRTPPRARPRPLRDQAALLRHVRERPRAVRVGDQGAARRSGAPHRARAPVALRLPAPRPPRPPTADGVRRRARARARDVGGRRRDGCPRAHLLGAGARHGGGQRPGGVPRPVRARGRATTGRRRACRHVPLGWHRLVVDREGVAPAARRARARRDVARRAPQDVLDRLRRRPDRRARVHGRRARRGRRRSRVRRADVRRVRARARPRRVPPGRAHRVDRAVRAVVRDATRTAERHGAAQRAGRRRAARRLRALPVRVPTRAAPPPQAARVRG